MERGSSWIAAYTNNFFSLQSPILFYFTLEDLVCLIKISQRCIWWVWGELIQESKVARLLISPLSSVALTAYQGVSLFRSKSRDWTQASKHGSNVHCYRVPWDPKHPITPCACGMQSEKDNSASFFFNPNLPLEEACGIWRVLQNPHWSSLV